MSRRFAGFLAPALALMVGALGMILPSSAQPNAEVRLALVIAQTNYSGELSKVTQAAAEARFVSDALARTGFDVAIARDLSKEQLRDALDQFRARVVNAGPKAVAFVYYTGHGAQHPQSGDSYLLGVDARINNVSDLATYGLDMQSQRDGFAATGARAIVLVFDACRNIPAIAGFKAGVKGLNRVDAQGDMLIAYSTSLNSVAEEGVYAPILASELLKGGRSAGALFEEVQQRVAQATNRKQLPWSDNRLYNPVCFAGCGVGSAGTVQIAPAAILAEPALSAAPDRAAFAAAQSGKAVAERVFRDRLRDGSDGPQMVAVPTGEFIMGAPESEPLSRQSERPQHRVVIDRQIAVGRYEVTLDEFRRFVTATNRVMDSGCYADFGTGNGANEKANWLNTGFVQAGTQPVACVSREDAKAYASWLSGQTGETYRLLSEAEWEYAARAGSATTHFFGSDPNEGCGFMNGADAAALRTFPTWVITRPCDDRYANTAPVGSYRPNQFGLFDMLGNVSEIVEDCSTDSYGPDHPSDGSAFTGDSCKFYVVRGGGAHSPSEYLRSAYRSRMYPDARASMIGFRLARLP